MGISDGRQLLMPAINQATDLGLRKRFIWLHGASVVLCWPYRYSGGGFESYGQLIPIKHWMM